MASPAQVANDMQLRATFWTKHDKDVAHACQDAAHVIRAYLDGPAPDGRTVGGVLTRLYRLEGGAYNPELANSLARAAGTITALRKEVNDAP
ncbi:hypothetical protein [Pararhodobacter sp.]|uniref:hypothetical protein n=1 Tax=Pararhodobacter sp. TaxID=2127056 RepID=UPI002AFFBD5B|nr:hypothetical protein [Pararhodobacter sp.]